MDFSEKFDKFVENNNLHRNEGDTGVQNLETIAIALGYRNEGYRYGSPIERFLSDNPGAIEALHDWIRDNGDNAAWSDTFSSDEDELEDEE